MKGFHGDNSTGFNGRQGSAGVSKGRQALAGVGRHSTVAGSILVLHEKRSSKLPHSSFSQTISLMDTCRAVSWFHFKCKDHSIYCKYRTARVQMYKGVMGQIYGLAMQTFLMILSLLPLLTLV